MKDFAHQTDPEMDVVEQLKSLTISRDSDPQIEISDEPTRKRGLLWLALGMTILGSGAWYANDTGYVDIKGIATSSVGAVQDIVTRSPEPEIAPVVHTAVAEPTLAVALAPAVQTIVGSGYVIAERRIALQSRMPGQITEVSVDIGDAFQAGDVLVRLDDRTYRAELAMQMLQVDRAFAVLARREAELAETLRLAELTERKVSKGIQPKSALAANQQTILLAQSEVQLAQHDTEIAQRQLATLQGEAEYHSIRAPFDGVVVERNALEGALVATPVAGGRVEPILTVIDPTALIIEADVSEMNLGQITVGQSADVTLDAYPDKRHTATVLSVVQQVSVQKGTVTVRLRFDTPPLGVLANMSAKLEFTPNTSETSTSGKEN